MIRIKHPFSFLPPRAGGKDCLACLLLRTDSGRLMYCCAVCSKAVCPECKEKYTMGIGIRVMWGGGKPQPTNMQGCWHHKECHEWKRTFFDPV